MLPLFNFQVKIKSESQKRPFCFLLVKESIYLEAVGTTKRVYFELIEKNFNALGTF